MLSHDFFFANEMKNYIRSLFNTKIEEKIKVGRYMKEKSRMKVDVFYSYNYEDTNLKFSLSIYQSLFLKTYHVFGKSSKFLWIKKKYVDNFTCFQNFLIKSQQESAMLILRLFIISVNSF